MARRITQRVASVTSERAPALPAFLQLGDRAQSGVNQPSGGMKRRLGDRACPDQLNGSGFNLWVTIGHHPDPMVHEILGLRPPAVPPGTESHGRMDHPRKALTGKG
jgi:hypothetical protein